MNQQVGNMQVLYYGSANNLIGQSEITVNNSVVDVVSGFNDYLVSNGLAKDVYICQLKIHQVQRPPVFNQNTQRQTYNLNIQPALAGTRVVIPGLGLQGTRANVEEEWNRWNEAERRRQQAGGVMAGITIPGIPQYPTGFKMPVTVDVIVPLDLSIQRFKGYTFSQLLRAKGITEVDRIEVRTVPLRCGLSAIIQ